MPLGSFLLQKDVLDEQQRIRNQVEAAKAQNRRAGLLGKVGGLLGGGAGLLLAGGLGPIGLALASGLGTRLGSALGTAAGGGFEGGGDVDPNVGLLRGTKEQAQEDLNQLRSDLRAGQWTSALENSLLAYAGAGGLGNLGSEFNQLKSGLYSKGLTRGEFGLRLPQARQLAETLPARTPNTEFMQPQSLNFTDFLRGQ